MALVSLQTLAHLDPQDTYNGFDRKFDDRVYIRFTIAHRCLTHVQMQANHSQRQVHFFLPDFETTQPDGRPIHRLKNTRVYIYCSDERSVTSSRDQYRERALYEIFIADRLEFHLNMAQIEVLSELADKAPKPSAEYDELATIAGRHIDRLKMMFQKHIDTQLSEEVAEVRQTDPNPRVE